MDDGPVGKDRKSVEEWADALLAQHRVEPPPPRGPRWYERELPRVGAVFQALEVIGVVLFCAIAFLLLHVAFNSG